jgi:DNA-binding MarR family transcriptional regulator
VESTQTAGALAGNTALDCAEFAAVLERFVSAWRRVSVPGELSSTAAFTLGRLVRHGSSRLTDLATLEHVSQPAMTQLVSRLEAQGLAERFSDPGDARVANVRVTAAGKALVKRRRAARAARLTELFSTLPPAQQSALAAALPALDSLADASAR